MKIILKPKTEDDYERVVEFLAEHECPDDYGLSCPPTCYGVGRGRCEKCWDEAIREAEQEVAE